jgi:hypothetical protein
MLGVNVRGESRHIIHAVYKNAFCLHARLGRIVVFEFEAFQVPLVFAITRQLIAFGTESVVFFGKTVRAKQHFDNMFAGNRVSFVIDEKQSSRAGDGLPCAVGTGNGMNRPRIGRCLLDRVLKHALGFLWKVKRLGAKVGLFLLRSGRGWLGLADAGIPGVFDVQLGRLYPIFIAFR